jgi:hypothetical protein
MKKIVFIFILFPVLSISANNFVGLKPSKLNLENAINKQNRKNTVCQAQASSKNGWDLSNTSTVCRTKKKKSKAAQNDQGTNRYPGSVTN